MGSLYKQWKGSCTILEIIPPQLCALAVGAVQKRAVADEENNIGTAQIVPITIAFDHRALDTADLVPFLQTLDRVLQDREWLEREISLSAFLNLLYCMILLSFLISKAPAYSLKLRFQTNAAYL